MLRVSLEQAQEQLPELIAAALRGEEVLIQQSEIHAVRLAPYTISTKRPQFGCAKGMIEMDDDFDEPLKDFKEYS